MSGFSPEWLALREPVDHRSRDVGLAARVRARFAGVDSVTVVDLGCGSGSNLRATSVLLGARQDWTLVDYDPRLLTAARDRLTAWADTATEAGDALALVKGGKSITVRFRQADLTRDLDVALGTQPDLVTASALFDLCSVGFIEHFAAAVAARRAAFYTVLTYDGVQSWQPAHEADAALLEAFRAHQLTDKGFGASAGWMAPQALAKAFHAAGYSVAEGDSPWRLEPGDKSLIADLAAGFADAAAETGRVTIERLADWRSVTRTHGTVGHTDTLALPA
ncbi:MAG: SAM-dependent methyltransferase [Hyphomicrobiaceae bacterium]